MNISVFGDSIAKGIVYSEERQRYTVSRKGFVELIKDKGVTLRNFSHMGFSSLRGRKTMDRHPDALENADYTLLEYGGNDCDLDWKKIAENPLSPHKALVTLPRFRKTITEMVEKVLAAGSTPVLMTLPPLDPSRFFQWITRDLDWESIYEFLDRDLENISQWHDAYSLAISEIAADRSIPLIDVRRLFLEQPDYKTLLCIDGMHPNEEGHRLIAQQVAATLIPADR